MVISRNIVPIIPLAQGNCHPPLKLVWYISKGKVMVMSYNKYPKEMKDAVVSRILSGEETLSDICRETGININTLYRWRDAA